MLLWCRPHPSLQAKSSCACSNSLWVWWRFRSAQTLNLPPDYDKEQTSPLASLKAQWPAEQTCPNAWRYAPYASLWPLGPGTLVCAHGTTILTNREASELVAVHIFYALQVRTRTILGWYKSSRERAFTHKIDYLLLSWFSLLSL